MPIRRSTLRAALIAAWCLSCGRTERDPDPLPGVPVVSTSGGSDRAGAGNESIAGGASQGGERSPGIAGRPALGGAPPDDEGGKAGDGGAETEGGAPADPCIVQPGDDCGVSCQADFPPAHGVVQLAAGVMHVCALLTNGTVKCWGFNEKGGLGLCNADNRGDQANEVSASLPNVDLGGPAVALSAGATHTCAILSDGGVKCWGGNSDGQLGVEDAQGRGTEPGQLGEHLPRVKLGTGRTAKAISASVHFTCALLDDGGVKCWGSNLQGELGLGSYLPRGLGMGDMGDALPEIDLGTGRTAVAITTGLAGFVCAILDDGAVKCWGENGIGELGLGSSETRGTHPGEMGDALPAVKLGAGRSAIAIASGNAHTCVILDDHSVKCWGLSESGAIGQGLVFTRGNVGDAMGDTLPTVDLGTKRTAKSIAAGEQRTCAILDDDTLKCWGHNFQGGLGLGDRASRGWLENQMGDQLPTVDLGTGHHALQVVVGAVGACALLENRHVKCWGGNNAGVLGRNDGFPYNESIGDEPDEMGDHLGYVELF
jgi:hypothetical protein